MHHIPRVSVIIRRYINYSSEILETLPSWSDLSLFYPGMHGQGSVSSSCVHYEKTKARQTCYFACSLVWCDSILHLVLKRSPKVTNHEPRIAPTTGFRVATTQRRPLESMSQLRSRHLILPPCDVGSYPLDRVTAAHEGGSRHEALM